jgi:glycosyltransferase involved in cell wall biosynthesis
MATGRAPAHLLDLTRLLSRAGRGAPTGIDRVERAWAEHLIARPEPALFLAATRDEWLLFGRVAARTLLDALAGRRPWGPPDLRALIARRLHPDRRRAEAGLRRAAIARARAPGLAAMLARHLPPGTRAWNVGHADLSDPVLAALKAVPGLELSVLLHDTIPLDFPAFARAGTVAAFAAKVAAVARHADRVLFPSAAARDAARPHLERAGRVPRAVVAPPGVGLAAPDPAALPPGLPPARPYLVTLGTIEPRKNHALLLDAWEHLHATLPEAEIPALVIAGGRGWADPALLRRLDRAPFRARTLFEAGGLPDGAVAALLAGSAGLLFPSLAEGYGLPPLEAAALGLPVVAAPLSVYRETLGDRAVYLDPHDRYLWARTALDLAERHSGRRDAGREACHRTPGWDEHFNAAFTGEG